LIETEDSPFSIKIRRRSDNEIIFDTSIGPLIFYNQFIQVNDNEFHSF
jgi:maltase-glucoamylase